MLHQLSGLGTVSQTQQASAVAVLARNIWVGAWPHGERVSVSL